VKAAAKPKARVAKSKRAKTRALLSREELLSGGLQIGPEYARG
jgi:hypothetical protein